MNKKHSIEYILILLTQSKIGKNENRIRRWIESKNNRSFYDLQEEKEKEMAMLM